MICCGGPFHIACCLIVLASCVSPAYAFSGEAKDAINGCEPYKPGMKFLPGKSCQAKGADNQPKDTKGTKKDPKYLRALQDCRAKCQAPAGKPQDQSSNECIKACRDEVCTTYEQCTYQIGPKEDYGGFFF